MRIFLYLFILLTTFSFAQKNTNKSIGFIENKGQIVDQKGRENKSVYYLLNTNGLNVQLRKNGFSYDVYQTKTIPLKEKNSSANNYNSILNNKNNLPEPKVGYLYHRIDIDFLNSNPEVKFLAEEKSADYDNYYNVNHAPQGITNVHKFQKVTYLNIYNNIDVVFFIPKDSTKTVEYNFIVKPGGKVSDIQLKFNGAKTELAGNKIKMNVRFGEMEETIPLSWVEENHIKKEVAINYRKIKKNVYGFEGQQFQNKTLIIDPTPIRLWGTYYTGNNSDFSTDICNDNNNNVYFSGYTYSTINIATSGSYTVHDYSYFYGNSFIVKFNSSGVRLWGIYSIARVKKIKADNIGNIYYTGDIGASMPNISTINSHQPLHTGYYDNAFLIKINSSGVREWATYYGGNSSDSGNDICFDTQNNVYLVGKAGSLENIATNNTHQPVHAPGYLDDDGFIAKFTPLGIRVWGTYFGGNENDQIHSCHISNDGFLYITGSTGSTQGIATLNSFNTNLQGYASGMIAKFDLNGNRIWGSYFNGSGYAIINQSILKDDHLYFFGITNNQTSMNTSGTFNESFVHLPMFYGRSSFIAKFNITTQSLIWGTYFGEYIQDIAVNSNNQVFIGGCTSQLSGIATPGAFSEVPQNSDAYLIKLKTNGQREWGTYYGGECDEGTNGAADVNNKISIDSNNNIYLIGNTCSKSGISTPGAHQESHNQNSGGGIANIYFAKFQDCLSSPQVLSQNPCLGSNLELTASGGTNYSWTGPNGFTSNQQNPIIPNANTTHSGLYTCTVTGTGGCDGPASVNVLVGDNIAPTPSTTTLPTINGNCNTIITTIPTATDNCAGNIVATTTNPLSYSLPGTYTITWNYNDGNGNTATQNQTVVISSTALPTSSLSQQFCIQQNATINNISITGQNIKWYDSLTAGNLLTNVTLLQNGITYYASQTINGCESNRIPVTITIQNTTAPTGTTNQSFCSSQNATLNDIIVSGANIIWYANSSGTTVLPSTTLLTNNTTYYATQTINGCESPTRFSVTINLINTLNATNYTETLCDNLNNGTETVNLSNYNNQLISSTNGTSFSYYATYNGAENLIASEKINNYQSFQLAVETKIIYVRIDSSNGCHQIVELKLTVVSKPIISISDIMPICEGSSITVDAGTGFDNYSWSTGATTSSISISTPGNYSVSVSENHGSLVCTSVKNFSVVKSNIATVSEIVTSDWTFNQNTITVLLTGNSVGDYVYSIDGTNYQANNTFTGLESGEYTVFIKDKNGCGIQPEDFYLLMYPKFFTPNADSYNDYWKIKFSENEPNLTAKIFDRYGKFIKEFGANDIGWDGTLNGQAMPATDYWFVVKRQNGKEYRGHFSLKR
ncbi:T9SS type B sorting domain-containing protein [Flavobacterium sp. SM15]|uniref:DUF7948 domain-containing protein n=1 Tax=Flavobacterium sp. SM15 TaxID=2908005 RepID=UPI001EDBF1A7|nr:T9SS type B sorting domain-containing protein [Flavobacterium sp. SM15]MCG2611084.1 T9SS type B sorting domain-containing protein [Flavobacterium sp. SM15]